MRFAVLGSLLTLAGVAAAVFMLPAWSATQAIAVVYVWAYALVIITAWLPLLIIRRMLHRITDARPLAEQQTLLGSTADIDGRVLQNTLEQIVFAVLAGGLLTLSQAHHASMLLLAHAAIFTLGRACFWWGYRHRNAWRVYGFGLTFFGTLGVYAYATSFLLRAMILN